MTVQTVHPRFYSTWSNSCYLQVEPRLCAQFHPALYQGGKALKLSTLHSPPKRVSLLEIKKGLEKTIEELTLGNNTKDKHGESEFKYQCDTFSV